MKFLRYLAATLMMSAFVARPTDIANFNMYEKANESIREQPSFATRVVLMGNSITYFWFAMRPEFFEKNDLICRGIGGQSTYEMLMRFREDVVNLQPAGVVIAGGTNDVAENLYPYNEDRTFGNIKSMTEIARENNIEVFLASVLPTEGFSWNPGISGVKEKIESLNSRIKEYADALDIPYIDYYSAMTGVDRELYGGFTEDGVHPNKEGYLVMEGILLPVIRERIHLIVSTLTDPEEETAPGATFTKTDEPGTVILGEDAMIYDITGRLVANGAKGSAIRLNPGTYITNGAGNKDHVTKFGIQ